MAKDNNFMIQINYLDNKKYESKLARVYINQDDEDSWYELDNNALAAYKNILIKVEDKFNNTSFYTFLANTNIIVENNYIKINSTNQINFFTIAPNKVSYKEELKNINEQIKYFETSQMIGLAVDDFIELEVLKQKRYLYKMQNVMNLVRSELEHE